MIEGTIKLGSRRVVSVDHIPGERINYLKERILVFLCKIPCRHPVIDISSDAELSAEIRRYTLDRIKKCLVHRTAHFIFFDGEHSF